jgi:hypothetical protein
MTNEEIIAELNRALKYLESIDFMSHEKSVQNSNQLKTHKAFNTIDNLKKNIGGTKDGQKRPEKL